MSLRRVFVLLVTLCLLAAPWAAQAAGPVSPAADSAAAPQGSPRLIVELASKPLAIWSAEKGLARANGRLDLDSAAAKSYLAQLQKEQAAFVKQMKAAQAAGRKGPLSRPGLLRRPVHLHRADQCAGAVGRTGRPGEWRPGR